MDTTFSLRHTARNGASRFVIGANPTDDAGRLLTTNPRDFFKGLSPPGGLHAAGVSGTVCACATSPREARGSPPGVRPTCVSLSYVVHCAWHKTRGLSPLYDELQTLGNASPAQPDCERGFVSPLSHAQRKGKHREVTRTTAAAFSGEHNARRSHATRGNISSRILWMC
jgi:hypothetical protein